MKKRIVFVTDCIDIAYNELRATILNHVKKVEIEIEPVAVVAPFSIINGNFILRLLAETYSRGTIFSVILNPMKKRSARLIGKTKKKNFIFMSANTGALDWFLRDFGISELYELKDPGFFPFGGKYVHAPAISQIIMGKKLSELGKPFDQRKLIKLDLPLGTILHIDNFGLMKFVGKLPKCKEGTLFEVKIGNKIIEAVYAKRIMSRRTGDWVIYHGSSFGLPELGKVRENGASKINAKIGDRILFKKLSK